MIFDQCLNDPHRVVCSLIFLSMTVLAVSVASLLWSAVLLLRIGPYTIDDFLIYLGVPLVLFAALIDIITLMAKNYGA